MGKIALYRHYRSQDFADLVGQKHVSATLDHAISEGKITHAYLFTGPRGVGKTSAARILARRVNEIEEVAHHPDIIEIDAASNNGVEEIRELREKVHIAPNFTKYKVYIIDEVHMLSTAAFNALLKTLEEPPSHAIFILATTEPHKLPQTIISRTQHFPFRPIASAAIVDHLKSIAKSEKIKITDDALVLLADLGEGSMRDSISLLDQISSSKGEEISVSQIEDLIGLAQTDQLKRLVGAIESEDSTAVLSVYDELLGSGVSPQLLIKQILSFVRREIRSRIQDKQPINSLRQLLQLLSSLPSNTTNSEFALEAIILRLSSSPEEKKVSSQAKNFQARIDPTSKTTKAPKPAPVAVKAPVMTAPSKKAKDKPTSVRSDNRAWIKTLSLVKQRHNSLYALLSNSDVKLDGKVCEITPKFQFHYRRLDERRTRTLIAEALRHACGEDVTVEIKPITVSKTKKATTPKATSVAKEEDFDAVAQVTKILGGEVSRG